MEQENIASDINCFVYDLFDHGIFFIVFQPKERSQIAQIESIIHEEIDAIIAHGVTEQELVRATKQLQNVYMSLLENNDKQACVIGKSFLATGNDMYLFNFLNYPFDTIMPAVQEILHRYFRASLAHKATLLPLAEKDKDLWALLQKRSDQEDSRILSQISRETDVEEGRQVHSIHVKEAPVFRFPKASSCTLPNGLTVLYYHNPAVKKIELILEVKAKAYYDPEDKQGLYTFLSHMMLEGTKKLSSAQLSDEIETRGMSIEAKPGYISMSMLSDDFKEGLSLLKQILMEANFPEHEMEKIRTLLQTDVHNFWDQPTQFVGYLARKEIYKKHPYGGLSLGTEESLEAISRDDLLEAYKQYISPQHAVLSIVGDLEQYDVPTFITDLFKDWQGEEIASVQFSALQPVKAHEITYPMNRDQIVLAFAGPSISRSDSTFDKILLFDQIFAGGALGTMSSRLFELREQSGLFYTIGGSLLFHTDEQPGMVFVRTIVSQDRLQEAEVAIKNTINTAAAHISEEELQEAKDAITHTLVDNFGSNRSIASTFLFLHRFDLPADYFDNRAKQLASISISDIQQAVIDLLDTNHMVTIKIGRLEEDSH